MRTRRLHLLVLLAACAAPPSEPRYVPPRDPLVQARLEEWRDLKLGLLVHWGTYSQWGVVESWTLCSEDQPWCDRGGEDYCEYKQRYERLIETFDPRAFEPERWARAAAEAGMRYLVFTTKHHDGFCMWDTRETDYKITSERCPFHTSPNADVTRALFDAFRARGFRIGAYFSKPDWHSDDYWAHEWATPDRCVNYDTRKYPERWQRFRDFTFRQIRELMTGYGRIDILWLDGGWVRPNDTITDEVRSWGYRIPDWEQDVDIPRIAAMAREHQPGLLVVDRTVHGPYEDYRTPEQRVPDAVLPYPWETCLSMSQSWSYNREPRYKSARELVHTLVDVVAKGGNLLLGVGPGPDGRIDEEAYERLAALGAWMRANGAAIYATRPVAPHAAGRVRYTRSKDGASTYAILLAAEGEERPPAAVELTGLRPARGARVLLVETGDELPWEPSADGARVTVPPRVRDRIRARHAWAFEVR